MNEKENVNKIDSVNKKEKVNRKENVNNSPIRRQCPLLKVLSVLLCVLLTVCLVQIAGHIVRPLKVDKDVSHIENFNSMPENAFELIGYGSSHIYWALDMMEMYDRYGIGGYNYGNDGQHINTTLLFFKESLKTQKPKVALIETFMFTEILQDSDMEREIYTTRLVENSKDKWNYLQQCFGDNLERWISYVFPLFGFHENWSAVTPDSFKRNSSDVDFSKTMGYYSLGDIVEDIPTVKRKTTKLPLPEDSVALLDELLAVAEEHGVQVVFYSTPFHGWYDYADDMARYASEHNVPYINMFELYDEIGFDSNTDFHDKGHLNSIGAVKAADYLGAFLVDKYELTDFRTVPDNLWEQAKNRQ